MKKQNIGSLISTRLIGVLRVNHTVTSILLGFFGILVCVGLASTELHLHLLVVATVTYSLVKLFQSIFRVPLLVKGAISIIGLYIWCFLMYTTMIFRAAGVGLTEPFLLVPLMWELAYIVSLIHVVKRYRSYSRRLNA